MGNEEQTTLGALNPARVHRDIYSSTALFNQIKEP